LEKALAGPGLLAQIVIDKYADHLPLYRQMQRFERSGVKLPYSTLTDWVSASCRLIEPLYEALKKEVLITGCTKTVLKRLCFSIISKVVDGKGL
jgi:transposase